MRVARVDPRDVTWETEPTGYRVHFWSRPGHGEQQAAWTADEHEVTGAGVVEVVARLAPTRGAALKPPTRPQRGLS